MGLPAIRHDLLEVLEQLGDDDQRRVLDFARALGHEIPKGKPGRGLLRHAGALPPDEVDRISAAIEEGCERINPNAW